MARFNIYTLGMSLLEITVVMAIFLTVSIIASDYIFSSLKTNIFVTEQNEALQNARKALNPLVKEVRETAPSANGNYPLAIVGTSSLTFYADTDNDSLTEKLHYYLSGTTIYRGSIKPAGSPLLYTGAESTSTIINYVRNNGAPVFTYYDTAGNLIANPASSTQQIRMIHVSIKVDLSPGRAPIYYSVNTNVQLRNLKDNL
ncbi:MAG: type II secretion system protein [Candidatus Falkowbacteria bacterium]